MVRRALLMSAVLALLIPASVGAAVKNVVVEDFVFRPSNVRVAVGDLVNWSRSAGAIEAHNVRAAKKALFYSGTATNNPNFNFRRRFSAGEFRYFCEVHATIMRGVVNVPVAIGRAPAGLNFGVRWANGRTNTGTRFDVQFRVGSGKWRAWRTNTKTSSGVFGKSGRPVRVANGTRYRLRARSQKKRSESKWSPVKSFRP
jgi:plastocyanin